MPLIAEIASDYKLTKERAQYEALLPILTDYFKSSAEPVYYLGNVSFNRANMDAMLLSQHFWMILEFKHYPGMDRVIVTDNQWDADGNDEIWYYVDSNWDATTKIFWVNNELDADIKVFFVDRNWDAGWARGNNWQNRL